MSVHEAALLVQQGPQGQGVALADHMDMVWCDVSTAHEPHLQLPVLCFRPLAAGQGLSFNPPAGLVQGLCCRCATSLPAPPAAQLHCRICAVLWPT